jgi:hypothetical protein
MRWRTAAIVNDDHLEFVARIVGARDAVQACAEVFRTAKGRYDYREANMIDPQRARVGPCTSLVLPEA